MSKVRDLFQKKRYTALLLCFVILSVIGYILNTVCPHSYFYFNQYLLFAMFFIQTFVMQRMNEENELIWKELLTAKEDEVQGSFKAKMNFLTGTLKGKLISVGLVFLYIFAMFRLGCLEYTITGVYGGVLGAVVFYCGIQLYFRYLSLLYFSYDLKNLRVENYFFYRPALTDWISCLAREFRYVEKWFLVLGLMYSGIYALNVPNGAVMFNNGVSLHTGSNGLFVLTWVGIIVFFILAAPIFAFLSRHYIKECIRKCKRNSIKELEKLFIRLAIHSGEGDLDIPPASLVIINQVADSEDYPLK